MADLPSKLSPQSIQPTTRFEPLLNSEEASALLKIHPKTLQRMARNKEIAGIQIGKLWRFRPSELDGWVRSKRAS